MDRLRLIRQNPFYLNGKSKSEILKEYDLYASTLNNWVKQHQETGSFKTKENMSDSQKELLELGKRNKQLEIENDNSRR